jgi:hypothetical protein
MGDEPIRQVTNVVEAILDRDQVKWDATWRLVHWLLDKEQGHQLGSAVRDAFCDYIFGERGECDITRECPLQEPWDGKGKFADLVVRMPPEGSPTKYVAVMDDVDRRSPLSRRKLDNLEVYRIKARKKFPGAIIRVVVLTNARNETRIKALYTDKGLKEEAIDFLSPEGWKLLPLHTVGEWVREGLSIGGLPRPEKMELFLRDFVEWTTSLDSAIDVAKVQSAAIGK